MRTTFTARHYKAPAKLKEFAEKEVQRLNKYYDGIIDCDIILDYEKQTQVAEIILSVYGQRLTAIEKSEDIRKSITLAVDKLERQLKKYKTKWNKKGNEKPVFVEKKSTEVEEDIE
ncbi:MAG: ribosome-associated translation inhibitor RaiA [Calditrichaeota bacterium]|nr:MAG: ribosome-associated translation inhibitor RaiA [Calditrichota bacterium]